MQVVDGVLSGKWIGGRQNIPGQDIDKILKDFENAIIKAFSGESQLKSEIKNARQIFDNKIFSVR